MVLTWSVVSFHESVIIWLETSCASNIIWLGCFASFMFRRDNRIYMKHEHALSEMWFIDV
jgi:hypothetical protein